MTDLTHTECKPYVIYKEIEGKRYFLTNANPSGISENSPWICIWASRPIKVEIFFCIESFKEIQATQTEQLYKVEI